MSKFALHSVSYAGIWADYSLSLEDFIDHAADLGYDGVMLMAKRPHASLLEMNKERRTKLRRQLERRHLEVASIAAYTDFTAGADRPDIPLREAQILYVQGCAELARDLDCNIVRVFTGYERPEAMPSQSWKQCVQAIKECGRRATDWCVTIAVQNHHDIANHHEAMFNFLTEVDEPNVKAGYDAWAPALHGLSNDELAASVRLMAPYTVQTIVADYVLVNRFRYDRELNSYQPQHAGTMAVPMGEGFIDYTAFFNALRGSGYDGYFVYEMCSPIRGGGSKENLDRCARGFVKWMRDFDR